MKRGKYRQYDDDVLIREIASGQKTYVEIGREIGLAETAVGRIAPSAVRRLGLLVTREKEVPPAVQRREGPSDDDDYAAGRPAVDPLGRPKW